MTIKKEQQEENGGTLRLRKEEFVFKKCCSSKSVGFKEELHAATRCNALQPTRNLVGFALPGSLPTAVAACRHRGDIGSRTDPHTAPRSRQSEQHRMKFICAHSHCSNRDMTRVGLKKRFGDDRDSLERKREQLAKTFYRCEATKFPSLRRCQGQAIVSRLATNAHTIRHMQMLCITRCPVGLSTRLCIRVADGHLDFKQESVRGIGKQEKAAHHRHCQGSRR